MIGNRPINTHNVSDSPEKALLQSEDRAAVGAFARPLMLKLPLVVCLEVKPAGKPDAVVPHVRFDERGWETELYATAPVLDSTGGSQNGRDYLIALFMDGI